jgi:hypothetical protein
LLLRYRTGMDTGVHVLVAWSWFASYLSILYISHDDSGLKNCNNSICVENLHWHRVSKHNIFK